MLGEISLGFCLESLKMKLIFCIRQLVEKYREYKWKLYIAFIDLELI